MVSGPTPPEGDFEVGGLKLFLLCASYIMYD